MPDPTRIPWGAEHHDPGCARWIADAGENNEIHLDPSCAGCRTIMGTLLGRYPNGRGGWTRSSNAARPR